MKKRNLRMLACAIVISMSFSLCACSNDSDKKVKTEESNIAKDTDGKNADGLYVSMRAFVESDELQSQLNSLLSSLEGTGKSMEIKAEDNKLIYSYKYNEIVKADWMTEQFQSGIVEQEATFSSVAASLSLAVDVENPVVVVECVDANGEVIYSQEFTATE